MSSGTIQVRVYKPIFVIRNLTSTSLQTNICHQGSYKEITQSKCESLEWKNNIIFSHTLFYVFNYEHTKISIANIALYLILFKFQLLAIRCNFVLIKDKWKYSQDVYFVSIRALYSLNFIGENTCSFNYIQTMNSGSGNRETNHSTIASLKY